MGIHSEHEIDEKKEREQLEKIGNNISAHHERFDGKGYPRGLKGEEIPIVARISAVAEAYSSMVKGRPYRKTLKPSEAIRELFQNSGTQFDPKVVEALVKGILEKGLVTVDDVIDAKRML